MSELGVILKKAREERGFSLDDIQEMTKIRKRYLEAIEEGNYKVLPGNFYVRAFVKNYAEAVGLDADEVLQLYHQEIPASAAHERIVEQPILKPRRAPASSQTSDRVSKWGFRLLMWSFIIVIAVVVYVFAIKRDSGGGGQTADNTPITNQDQPPALNSAKGNTPAASGQGQAGNTSAPDNAGTKAPATPPDTTKTAPTLTLLEKMKKSTDRYSVTPAGAHKYEIAVTGSGSCWYEIKKGGKNGSTASTATLKKGAIVAHDLEGIVYIAVGNASIVDIKVDGQVLDDGNSAGPRRFIIEPSDNAAGKTAP